MDNSLRALCDAIKKIVDQLKPQANPLSFLVITGKKNHGKSSLLKQSHLSEIPILGEQQAKLYFGQDGIILELSETWLSNSKTILQNTLKQLNRCHKHLKITGLILCIDINDLLISEPVIFTEQKNAHLNFLTRFGTNLDHPIELAIILTKMDALAGFSEFYQVEHVTDLAKPFGFSLECINQINQKIETYNQQFNQLVELISQQVINKIHPVRSTVKRTLIREFPLQLASLRHAIQSIVQGISPQFYSLHSIYFTSAEQGGISIDRLNKKIQHEYSLAVQDTFPQATNFRAYFVEGALKVIQNHCKQSPKTKSMSQKPLMALTAGVAGICFILLGHHYFRTAHLLDEASKELIRYDQFKNQETNTSQALYHLSKAAKKIDAIKTSAISLPKVHKLQVNLHQNAQNKLSDEFIPAITMELEHVINSATNTPIVRYKALKIYLMLHQPEHLSIIEVKDWFQHQWQHQKLLRKKMTLLDKALSRPFHHIATKPQVISDARNYLNALPGSYLYYSLAKELFPNQKEKISIDGFHLATHELPFYFSKSGFKKTIDLIPQISTTLQSEHWVLARQDLGSIKDMLIQAYCFDYVTWWQTFMKKSQPFRYQDYHQGRQVAQVLTQTHAFYKIIGWIQQETKPDLTKTNSLFNQQIASQFTDINLISLSNIKNLGSKITELERFVSTLSVVNDGGKTAFAITKLRFVSEHPSDPISSLFNQSQQLPEPLSAWAKQIAADAWVILIKDSRDHMNQRWQNTVYSEFQNTIAKRYPFDSSQNSEIAIADFNRFFSTNGTLNAFSQEYIQPFLDRSTPEWKPKVLDGFVVPISTDTLDQLIRANIISNMFFPDQRHESQIEFSLQKINLDPVVSSLQLEIGDKKLTDTQSSESTTHFSWPQNNAKLALDSIEGNHYELAEQGAWAIFKLLEKVNVLVDEQDSSSLQILFEVNSNSGRYLLKTNNQINPFTPGILNGFTLNKELV